MTGAPVSTLRQWLSNSSLQRRFAFMLAIAAIARRCTEMHSHKRCTLSEVLPDVSALAGR